MGGSSSSASTNATSTTNTDKRLVVSDQAIGLSSDSSTVNISMADQGAIAGAAGIADRAITAMSLNDAMAGTNYQDLLKTTADAFNTVSAAEKDAAGLRAQSASDVAALSAKNYGALLSTTTSAMSGLFSLADKALTGGFGTVQNSLGAISSAQDTANSKGTLDNRTITILGVAAAVAVGAYAMRK